MIAPVESIIYLGDHATFSCYTSCPNAHQWWEVITNSSYNKQEDHSGSRHDIHISGLKAYATIQCSVFCDVKWSGNASLQIQGIVLHMSLSWHVSASYFSEHKLHPDLAVAVIFPPPNCSRVFTPHPLLCLVYMLLGDNNNNNTQIAAIAFPPSTMHPLLWAEPHTQGHTHAHTHELIVG